MLPQGVETVERDNWEVGRGKRPVSHPGGARHGVERGDRWCWGVVGNMGATLGLAAHARARVGVRGGGFWRDLRIASKVGVGGHERSERCRGVAVGVEAGALPAVVPPGYLSCGGSVDLIHIVGEWFRSSTLTGSIPPCQGILPE